MTLIAFAAGLVAGVVATLAGLAAIDAQIRRRRDLDTETDVAAALAAAEDARRNTAWRRWCETHPGSPAEDDSRLDIHQWGEV